MLITFHWTPSAGSPEVDRVLLHITAVHDHHHPDLHRMSRVTGPDGGRWESTLEVPDDLVASYRIMPVTADLATELDAEPDSRLRWMTVVRQTVPHVLDHPAWRPAAFSEGFGEASGRLVMPDAPEQAGWGAVENADGTAVTDWAETTVNGRTLWTADLPGADHVLLISDGRNWSRTALPAALRRLHEEGRLPEVGVVAVDTAEGRYGLLTRSAEYRGLIADRVVPWAWAQVGRRADPRRTVVSGESLGGLAALDVVLTRPDVAALAVCTSGSFWYPAWNSEQVGGEVAAEILDRAAAGTLPDIRVHLSAGTGEGRPGSGRSTMADHSTAVFDALAAGGVPATLEISTHGHEMAGWTGALTRGLVELSGETS
ncbi:enterochelin esterase domain-containing protein [uncultured Corynebacterium sp.]|uniref:enterochelin esterase domain-containing protein n=1 Tax=uncultured Corynebacterium sp. TaxID=159447 RepID=UPI0025E993F6|nr:enterochelin esterase domain-containing protein [uncultured Corynebacterium sp.]